MRLKHVEKICLEPKIGGFKSGQVLQDRTFYFFQLSVSKLTHVIRYAQNRMMWFILC